MPGADGIARASHRSGGTEGGMSTGEVLRVRAAMKPIATVPRALRTVDTATGEAAVAHHQRSDVCAVPAAGVVAEAMVALVLADAALEKFGGDSVAETRRNYEAYLKRHRRPRPAGRARRVSPDGSADRAGRRARARASPPSGGCWPTGSGVPFADVDAVIADRVGKPSRRSSPTTARRCSGRWRSRSPPSCWTEPGVLALGGGAVLSARTRAALAAAGWSGCRSACRTRSSRSG